MIDHRSVRIQSGDANNICRLCDELCDVVYVVFTLWIKEHGNAFDVCLKCNQAFLDNRL